MTVMSAAADITRRAVAAVPSTGPLPLYANAFRSKHAHASPGHSEWACSLEERHRREGNP
jgi:hypothetical protein